MNTAQKLILLLAEQGYANYIAGIKPAGLIWLGALNELTGTTQNDLSAQNNDATYRDAGMLAQGEFLTGEPCPLWTPGDADYLSMPASFLADFSIDECCIVIWSQVRVSTVWTDGIIRGMTNFRMNANNRVGIQKAATNNAVSLFAYAGGTFKQVDILDHSPTTWQMYAVKASKTDDQMKAFLNNTQAGSTQTGLGTAAGAITSAVIGASDIVGSNVWDGHEAYGAVWAGAGNLPSDAEIAGIYNFLAG